MAQHKRRAHVLEHTWNSAAASNLVSPRSADGSSTQSSSPTLVPAERLIFVGRTSNAAWLSGGALLTAAKPTTDNLRGNVPTLSEMQGTGCMCGSG